MSRIGKLPIHIPQGVTVAVSPDNTVTVKVPKGQLSQQVSADLTVTVEENEVHVAVIQKIKNTKHSMVCTVHCFIIWL